MRDFEELLDGVYPDAVRFARAMAGSESDGDDLVQDALYRAWRAFPRLRDRERFKPWLLQIIRNAHRSRARRRRIVQWFTLDGAEHVAAAPGIGFEEKDAVRRALRRVPRAQREAIVLFEVLGMSIEEIAGVQQAGVSAVKSRLSRGRQALRESYERLTREK